MRCIHLWLTCEDFFLTLLHSCWVLFLELGISFCALISFFPSSLQADLLCPSCICALLNWDVYIWVFMTISRRNRSSFSERWLFCSKAALSAWSISRRITLKTLQLTRFILYILCVQIQFYYWSIFCGADQTTLWDCAERDTQHNTRNALP